MDECNCYQYCSAVMGLSVTGARCRKQKWEERTAAIRERFPHVAYTPRLTEYQFRDRYLLPKHPQ